MKLQMEIEGVIVSPLADGFDFPETREQDEHAAARMSYLSEKASAAHEQAIAEIEARKS
ncbi:MAG: hypothetical protein I8H77_13910 [Comamonadaceae bacterium]|nr:hypothetical protein [Comamonadaceae bacterium]